MTTPPPLPPEAMEQAVASQSDRRIFTQQLVGARRRQILQQILAGVLMLLGAIVVSLIEWGTEGHWGGWKWSTTIFFTGLALLGFSQVTAIEIAIREGRLLQ
jgi:hypothetical protein